MLCLDGGMVFLYYIVHLQRTELPETSRLSMFLEPKLIFHGLSIWQEIGTLALAFLLATKYCPGHMRYQGSLSQMCKLKTKGFDGHVPSLS